jgi:DNA replication and repair protein RecF
VQVALLSVAGVRNLAPLQLAPRARFNVFVGNNGQGKTNLLEALYVVSALRSFRTAKLSDLIAFGESKASIGARVERGGMTRIYEVDLEPSGRKVRLDDKAVRPLARYFGGFNVVVFTPEDLGLPRGAPGDRRKFLDRAVFNVQPDFLATALDYDKALKQRNALLKMAGQGALTPARLDELLAGYDPQLARLGVALATARRQVIERLGPDLATAFSAITRSGLVATARYVSEVADATPEQVEQMLREGRARDVARQSTSTGPHRDDVLLELEGHEAGSFASQGQLRAIMLAWKSAELVMRARAHGDPPILLLDDVSSELDPSRNAYLFEHIAAEAGQCFITTTHEDHVLVAKDRANYRIENGKISS